MVLERPLEAPVGSGEALRATIGSQGIRRYRVPGFRGSKRLSEDLLQGLAGRTQKNSESLQGCPEEIQGISGMISVVLMRGALNPTGVLISPIGLLSPLSAAECC